MKDGELLPNIFLITVDCLRPDYLSCYGSKDCYTPNIDRLAEEGVIFKNAFSHIPITGPSISTIFTSLYPSEHGVINNGFKLDRDRTLPVILKEHGYKTIGAVGGGVLISEFGYNKGFDIYIDDFSGTWKKGADRLNKEVIEVLNKISEPPFFFWIHYFDLHEPYFHTHRKNLRILFNEKELGIFPTDGSVVNLKLDCQNPIKLEFIPLKEPMSPASEGISKDTRNLSIKFLYKKYDDYSLEFGKGWYDEERGGGEFYRWLGENADLYIIPRQGKKEIMLNFRCEEFLTTQELKSAYKREIVFFDKQLGYLMSHLSNSGILENTLIILTSDHGEALREFGHTGHIDYLYDVYLQVPLIFRLPSLLHEGLKVETEAQHVDLLPTILDILDISLNNGHRFRGNSLLPLLSNTQNSDINIREYIENMGKRWLFAETHPPEAKFTKKCVRKGGYKLIYTKETETYELYNFINEEKDNIFSSMTDKAEGMKELLQFIEDSIRQEKAERVEDEEIRERLRTLGYV